MRNQTYIILAVLAFFISLPRAVMGNPSNIRWLVYYGDHLSPQDLQGIDLAIVDPDAISPKNYPSLKTKFLGYVSVGEAEVYRSYWPQIQGKDFIVEKNPVWKDAHLVDIRSQHWRKLLLNEIIPSVLQKGFQGVFLDTIDTAIYLEDKDPIQFKGSKKAMVKFVKTIKKKFPGILILPNNGLEILEEYGEIVHGVVVEDLYTQYDFSKKVSRETPNEIIEYKEKILDKFQSLHKKPVFNILYEKSVNEPLAHKAIRRCLMKGYSWYLTTVDLTNLGTTMLEGKNDF